MKKILEKYRAWKRRAQLESRIRKHLVKNGCICHCQYCNYPLFERPTISIGDASGCWVTLCEYTCSSCEMESMFVFGLAPVPLLVDKDMVQDA